MIKIPESCTCDCWQYNEFAKICPILNKYPEEIIIQNECPYAIINKIINSLDCSICPLYKYDCNDFTLLKDGCQNALLKYYKLNE